MSSLHSLNDLLNACEEWGIRVVSSSESAYRWTDSIIGLSSKVNSDTHLLFDLAHEVGHHFSIQWGIYASNAWRIGNMYSSQDECAAHTEMEEERTAWKIGENFIPNELLFSYLEYANQCLKTYKTAFIPVTSE